MAVVAFNHLKSLALKVKAEIAEVANAAADALEELEAQKPDKAQEVSATIRRCYGGLRLLPDLRDAGRENPIPCLAGPGQCHLCEVSDSARKGVSLWATMEV